MRDFAWVKMALRVLGVYFVVEALPSIAYTIVNVILYAQEAGATRREMFQFGIAYTLGSLVSTAAGLYLLFGGRRVFQWCIRDLHNCCIHCGYTFKGLISNTCPECGTERPVESSAQTPPPPAAERSN